MTATPSAPTTTPRRLLGGAALCSFALALLLAACGGREPEADAAAPSPPAATRSAAPATDEDAAGSEQRLERASRRSREALDRLAGVVDGLTPDQRLEFDEPLAELERRYAAAVAGAGDLEADAGAKPAAPRKLVRELSRIATEAAALLERAEALAPSAD